jgi:hypothetical protein
MAGKFLSGASKAKEITKHLGGGRRGTDFFKLEDGQTAIIRFLTDANPDPENGVEGWISVITHPMVPTKPKPKDWDGKWPNTMSAVCRRTPLEDEDGNEVPYSEDCWICDNVRQSDGKAWRRSGRTFALAVVREEVREGGVIKGYRDEMVEYEELDEKGNPTGKTGKKAKVVQVEQGYKNFFSAFVGTADHHGTLLNRDFKVTREGAGQNDTEYHVVALDIINTKHPVSGEVVPLDLRDRDIRQHRYPDAPSLEEIVESKIEERFYDTFFIPEGGGAPAGEKPSGDASQADLDDVASRLKGYGGNGNGSEESAEEAPAEAKEEAPKEEAPADDGLDVPAEGAPVGALTDFDS